MPVKLQPLEVTALSAPGAPIETEAVGAVVDGSPADALQLRLALHRQLVVAVDHRPSLSNPALLSAPDLGVQRLHVHRRLRRAPSGAEYVSSALEQLAPPFGDLVRMHIVALRDLGDRLLALDRLQRHLWP